MKQTQDDVISEGSLIKCTRSSKMIVSPHASST